MKILIVTLGLLVSGAAFAQQPLKPSQVRPGGPAAKRSPGPMIDADNAKRGDDAVGASKKKPKTPADAAALGPRKSERTPEDQAKLDAVRARIVEHNLSRAEAERRRSMRAQMVAKALRSSTIPPAVNDALKRHVNRMAKLDRIEALAAEAGDTAVLDRVEKARSREQVRHSMWLIDFGEKQRGAK